MISLLNKTKQPEAVNLPHEDMCGDGECSCKTHEHRQLILDKRTGETRVRIVEQRISGSLHLLPGVWSDPVSDDVAEVPRVAEMIAKGKFQKKTVGPLPEPSQDGTK